MNLNERITKVIEYSEFTSSEFADEIDVQRSNISHITSGRNKPSLDFLIKIKDRFPELEWDWLIKGEGEMLQKADEKAALASTNEESNSTSLPDLFSLIDDDNFGITESEDRVSKPIQRESEIPGQSLNTFKTGDSQRLEVQENQNIVQHIENQENKIKRVVIFFENGKFESFEP
ncbi:helix-turn-helix transcriptional regulator [uncultured Chryseobacterium sp.]|uniref:helix-turn-helix domain-containing protein n=1 Tax=uncultured Chryseobacterium sp. TaxID=259322 RepID=UPI002609170C|nr:helix-turn-helix transcriptional regulator [uncultured Chryseobacterium sp.]